MFWSLQKKLKLYERLSLISMSHIATIAQRTKPKQFAQASISEKGFDGLPKVRPLYYFSESTSNLFTALGVSFKPAYKKKLSKILNLALLTTCNQSHEDLITGDEWLHKGSSFCESRGGMTSTII